MEPSIHPHHWEQDRARSLAARQSWEAINEKVPQCSEMKLITWLPNWHRQLSDTPLAGYVPHLLPPVLPSRCSGDIGRDKNCHPDPPCIYLYFITISNLHTWRYNSNERSGVRCWTHYQLIVLWFPYFPPLDIHYFRVNINSYLYKGNIIIRPISPLLLQPSRPGTNELHVWNEIWQGRAWWWVVLLSRGY